MKLRYDPNVVLDNHRWKQDGMTLKADIINGLDFSFVPRKTLNSVIATATGEWSMGAPYQRYTFYALGRFWAFYSNGTDMFWRTSTDGTTWGAATTVRAGWDGGYEGSFWFDGTYVHYVWSGTTAGNDIFYRMGLCNSDGTITWQAVEQTVLVINATHRDYDPHIVVDANGFPWIVYSIETIANGDTFAMVTKSKTKDGTWTDEDVLFTAPYQFSASTFDASTAPRAWGAAVPLSGGQMYAMMQPNPNALVDTETNIKGRLWDGSAWGAEETVATPATGNVIFGGCISPAADSYDNIYLSYGDRNVAGSDNYIYSTIRSSNLGTWSTAVLLVTYLDTAGFQAVSTVDTNDIVYVFWLNTPTVRHIYYRRYVNGAWEATTDWITETNAFSDEYSSFLNVAAQAYLGRIIFTFSSKAASPFDVKMVTLEQEGRIPPWLFHGNQVGRDFNKDSKFNSP